MAGEELSKKILRAYPWLFFFLVIILIFSHFVYSVFVSNLIVKKEIKIPKGMDVRKIAYLLEREEIIKSPFYFILLQKFIFPQEKVKSGSYVFSGKYNLIDVIRTLKRGKGVTITITEGKTLKEIEDIFKANGFSVSLENLNLSQFPEVDLYRYFPEATSLEGFLAPDTYHFYPDSDTHEIVLNILKNFQKKYLPEIIKSDLKPYQTLILASIVEKEAKQQNDLPIIAGILKKRLKNNMPLDVDATIVYAVCNGVFCDKKITSKSLPKDHPYQTYGKIGLPPTPISNPGLNAIKAVVSPSETKYWYYLTTKNGEAIYAETLKEHQENIKKYLE
jgi:UPF0755 protein